MLCDRCAGSELRARRPQVLSYRIFCPISPCRALAAIPGPWMRVMDDPIAVVRAMWEAEHDGSLDGVLATMHPDVVWTPLLRPGRSLYFGHEGIRAMRDNVDAALGSRRIVIDD